MVKMNVAPPRNSFYYLLILCFAAGKVVFSSEDVISFWT